MAFIKGHKGFWKDKERPFGKRKSHIAWNKGIKCPQLCGIKSGRWKGGKTLVTLRLRECLKYKFWREEVYNRDGYTCVWCGDDRGGNLNADHIIPFSSIVEKLKFEQGIENLFEKAQKYYLLWDVGNGRTLCVECHKKTKTFGGKLRN